MGKARKPKLHANKVNPTGLVDVNTEVEHAFANGRTSDRRSNTPLEAIREQLEGSTSEEKICGMQSLATICQGEVNLASVVGCDIVRIAAPLLVDPDQSVRHATAGALRNLSVDSIEMCEFMVEEDVLTPLLALLGKYVSEDWVPTFDKTMQNQMDEKADTFFQAISLLWNLCESTSVALNNFNQTQLLERLVGYLNHQTYGLDIATVVAQFLLVISEDNASSWRILSNYGTELCALATLDGTENGITLLRTVASGIAANVPALAVSYQNQIMLSISKTLAINHRTALGHVTSVLPLIPRKDVVDLEVTDDVAFDEETEEQSHQRRRRADLPSEAELEVQSVGQLLQAQRLAAEILTNLCSPDDDHGEDDMDDADTSDAESVHDYDATAAAGADGNITGADKLPVATLEAIKSFSLVEKLWHIAQPVAENVRQILADNERRLLQKLNALRISSMLCLHNLCNNITCEDLGGPEAIYAVWLDVGQQVFQGQDNLKLLEASTALMRATLEHLRKSPELFRQMTETDLQLMLNGVTECKDSEIRANWLRMLGILGCLLPEPLIKVIIAFVLETCSREDDLWTLSEALDAMMDIFADNDWCPIVYELGMVAKCKELDRILRTKLKQGKKQLNSRYPAVSTVRTNLSRFCKYLEGEMKSYRPNTEA